jgi:hypothetical protein
MTSRNIALTSEYPNGDFYTIICDCGSDDHNTSMIVEVEDGIVQIQFYKKIWCKSLWCPVSWGDHFKDWYNRFKIVWNVLSKGYAEYEGEFLIQNEQAIDDLVEAIQNSKLKMVLQKEEERKNWPGKSKKDRVLYENNLQYASPKSWEGG